VFHGDWLKMFDAPAQFERVTREQVRAVARDILDRSKLTVGVLMPVPEGEADGASGA
jgi:zinc protease